MGAVEAEAGRMRSGALPKMLAIARANLVRFLRDRFNYFFVFLFPLGLILILGLAFGTGFRPGVGVVVDDDPLAARLLSKFEEGSGFMVERVNDPAVLRERVERSSLDAGIIVPAGLSALLATGEEVKVEFITSSAGTGTAHLYTVAGALSEVSEAARAARFVMGMTGEGFEAALALVDTAAGAAPELRVERQWVNESAFGDMSQPFALSAGSQLVLFVFLTGLTSASALILSRKLGVSRRMLGSPTHVATIVAGEALGRYAVALFQGAYIIVATKLLFGVDWGDTLAAIIVLAAFAAVAAGAGMLLGALFNTDQFATGVAILIGLGLAALGGSMAPLELFGPTMRAVARAVPHSWATDAYAQLMRHGGGLMDVMPHVGVLALFAVGLFALASWQLQAKLLKG